MLTLYIIVSTLFILFFSYCLGMCLIKLLNINLNGILAIPLGFFSLLGLNQFFIYFFIFFKIPSIYFFMNYFLLNIIILGIGLKHITWSIPSHKTILVATSIFLYVLFMVYQSSQRTLGSNGFDTVHYLSMVIEGANQGFFSYVQYDNGLSTSSVNVQYDFQSYYYFGSMLVYAYDRINQWISPYYFDLSSSTYIWISSILYFVINFLVTFEIIKKAFVKHRLFGIVIGIFILFFTSNFYYTNVFTFYGNTYRTLILVFMYMLIHTFMNEQLKLSTFSILFMLISSALISVSSTGFFIGAMALFAVVMILIRYYPDIKLGRTIVVLSLPTLLFAIFYLSVNSKTKLVILASLLVLFYALLLMFDFIPRTIQTHFKRFFRNVFYYLIPLFIFIISIYLRIKNGVPNPNFFSNHKAYDMVWYYFDTNFVPLLINLLWFTILITFLLKSRNTFATFIRILLLTFINPISYVFVYRFIGSVVYYRAYELIFNNFTLVIMAVYAFGMITSKTIKNALSASLLVFVLIISIIQINTFYNPIFIADKGFSSLYKIPANQVEPLRELKTKIVLENYDNPVVVSQIEPVRGFVDVYTPIANETIRGLDKFKTVPETSKLLNIFVNRDHYGQMIFDKEPDYSNTCKYLMEAKADFVIVDRKAFYEIKPNQFEPLYFRVRECASEIFVNDDYILYQFYW